jgi:hypothetical protein
MSKPLNFRRNLLPSGVGLIWGWRETEISEIRDFSLSLYV